MTQTMTEAKPSQTQQLQKPAASSSETLERVSTLLAMAGALLVSVLYTLASACLALVPRRFKRHDITGQVALITGGGSGIGRLLCLKLAKKGAKVITWDINAAGNEETVRQVEALGHECSACTVDLCDKEDIYRAADELKGRGVKVDILVNNAGIVTGRNFLQSPDSLVEKTFAVNILSHFWTVKAFLPAMLTSNRGHIVTVASMAGKIGVNKLTDYCSSKFAAVGFDESLRLELLVNKNTGVHTTLVAPYYINTGMFDGVKSKFIPILEPEYVVSEVVDGILMRKKEVVLPHYANLFVVLKLVLSFEAQKIMFYASSINNSLDNLEAGNRQQRTNASG